MEHGKRKRGECGKEQHVVTERREKKGKDFAKVKFSKDIREMEEKRKRLEVEVEIGKRRMREIKE